MIGFRPLRVCPEWGRRVCRAARLALPVLCATLLPAGRGHGSSASVLQGDPASVGQWGPVQDWPLIPIHVQLLPTGQLLAWTRQPDFSRRTEVRLWDPETETIVGRFPTKTYDVFCAGHSFLPDGRLLVTGGHLESYAGIRDTHIFNPFTEKWSNGPPMNAPRWYPTQVELANGEVLTAGGTITLKKGTNRIPQVWKRSGGWRTLSAAKRDVGTYPFMHLAPNGLVFFAGPDQNSAYLSPWGQGFWTPVASSRRTWRGEGCSVLYDLSRVLNLGGDDPPTETAEVIDLSDRDPRWRQVGSMHFKRRHPNATLLPDGTVLVTGGTAGGGFNNQSRAVLPAELWDPETEAFRLMAAMTVPRIYHSTGILLPDARVLVGGGEGEGGTPRPNVQIYSPPYLFRGERPAVTGAPETVRYGERFTVSTPDAAGIAQVTWLRPGAVTHSVNMDQRIVRLGFTAGNGGLTVTAPASPRQSPPGYYMLFLVNRSGVPSIARFVRIG